MAQAAKTTPTQDLRAPMGFIFAANILLGVSSLRSWTRTLAQRVQNGTIYRNRMEQDGKRWKKIEKMEIDKNGKLTGALYVLQFPAENSHLI